MSNAIPNGLAQEHMELRKAMSEIKTEIAASIATLDGKIDRTIVLLETQAERQSRSERRVDKLESELDDMKDKHLEQRLADREVFRKEIATVSQGYETKISENKKKIEDVTMRVWIFMGGIGVLSFIVPIILRFLPIGG